MSAPARLAGTVVLLRDAAGGPEVLMVRRGRRMAFMADAFVFPGGRVDEGEPGGAAAAAAREAFEEAGVLLARDAAGAPVRLDGEAWPDEARRAIHDGAARLADVLAARGLALDTRALVPFARWVTPSSEPKRFDAAFFLARMPEGQTARHDAVEVSEHRWARPAALLEDAAGGALKLPPPTQWHLADLARFATVEEALAWARARRFETVAPKLVPVEDTVAVVLPWDPEFAALPGDGMPSAAPDPGDADPIVRFLLRDGAWVARRRGDLARARA